jgi:hypothetical protein
MGGGMRISIYEVTPEEFWFAGADALVTVEEAARHGWRAIRSWGHDGWNLGSWPDIVVFCRERWDMVSEHGTFTRPEPFELAVYVYDDGDVTAYAFPTAELRESDRRDRLRPLEGGP